MLPIRRRSALAGDDPSVGVHERAAWKGRCGRQQRAVAFGDVVVQRDLVVGRGERRLSPHNLSMQVEASGQGQASANGKLKKGLHGWVSEES